MHWLFLQLGLRETVLANYSVSCKVLCWLGSAKLAPEQQHSLEGAAASSLHSVDIWLHDKHKTLEHQAIEHQTTERDCAKLTGH